MEIQNLGPTIGDLKMLIANKEIELDFGRKANRQLAEKVKQLTTELETCKKMSMAGKAAEHYGEVGKQKDNGNAGKTDPPESGDQPGDTAKRSGAGRTPAGS